MLTFGFSFGLQRTQPIEHSSNLLSEVTQRKIMKPAAVKIDFSFMYIKQWKQKLVAM